MFNTKRYYKCRKKFLLSVILNELERYSYFYNSNNFITNRSNRKRKLL